MVTQGDFFSKLQQTIHTMRIPDTQLEALTQSYESKTIRFYRLILNHIF